MAHEDVKSTGEYSRSDKLGIALACLAGVMAIILFLVEKTPLTVVSLLTLMIALSIFPILHFARSSPIRIALMILAVIGAVALGRFEWPKKKPPIVQTNNGFSNSHSDGDQSESSDKAALAKNSETKLSLDANKKRKSGSSETKKSPANDNSGSVGGNITQGPCSNLQIGGNKNQAIGGNCGPPSRRISPEIRASLIEILSKTPGDIAVDSLASDSEGLRFALDWREVLGAAGWRIQQIGTDLLSAYGVFVVMDGDRREDSVAESAIPPDTPVAGLLQALHKLNVEGLSVSTSPKVKNLPEGTVRLIIGYRPGSNQ
jgi:hypothetical protein